MDVLEKIYSLRAFIELETPEIREQCRTLRHLLTPEQLALWQQLENDILTRAYFAQEKTYRRGLRDGARLYTALTGGKSFFT